MLQETGTERNSESDYLIDTPQLQLNRTLTSRHIQMIAIGGTIGTGVFLGSGATIANAGPLGALLGYSIVGILVYSIMTSLGELATHYPISGSFSTYAGKYVDPALGFALGWNYWFQWAISFPSELSAAGLIIVFWFPTFPTFIAPLSILIILVSVHLFGVEKFGETEYWLSLIKVVAIVFFIVAGLAVDLGFVGNGPIYLENWAIEGAPFKNGNLI
jgi:lysine-specific permease